MDYLIRTMDPLIRTMIGRPVPVAQSDRRFVQPGRRIASGQAPSRPGAPARRGLGRLRCSSAPVEGESATGIPLESGEKRSRSSAGKGRRTGNRTGDARNGSAPTQAAVASTESAALGESADVHEGEAPVPRGPSTRRGTRSKSPSTGPRGGKASGGLEGESPSLEEETAAAKLEGRSEGSGSDTEGSGNMNWGSGSMKEGSGCMDEGSGSMKEGSGSGAEAGGTEKKSVRRKKKAEEPRSVESLALSVKAGLTRIWALEEELRQPVAVEADKLAPGSVTAEDFMSLPKGELEEGLRSRGLLRSRMSVATMAKRMHQAFLEEHIRPKDEEIEAEGGEALQELLLEAENPAVSEGSDEPAGQLEKAASEEESATATPEGEAEGSGRTTKGSGRTTEGSGHITDGYGRIEEGSGRATEGSGSGTEAGTGGKKRRKRQKNEEQENEEERSVRSLALSLVAGLTTVEPGDFAGPLADAVEEIDPRSVTVEDFLSLPRAELEAGLRARGLARSPVRGRMSAAWMAKRMHQAFLEEQEEIEAEGGEALQELLLEAENPAVSRGPGLVWPDEATAEDSGGDLPSGPGRQQGRQVTTRGRKEARTKSSEEAYSYEEPVHDLDYYNEYDDAPELDREEDEEEEEEEDEEPRLEGQPRRASKYAVVWDEEGNIVQGHFSNPDSDAEMLEDIGTPAARRASEDVSDHLHMMYPHAGESAGLDAPRPTVRGPQSRRAPKWVPQRTADPFDGTDDDDDGLSDSDEGLLQKLGDFSSPRQLPLGFDAVTAEPMDGLASLPNNEIADGFLLEAGPDLNRVFEFDADGQAELNRAARKGRARAGGSDKRDAEDDAEDRKVHRTYYDLPDRSPEAEEEDLYPLGLPPEATAAGPVPLAEPSGNRRRVHGSTPDAPVPRHRKGFVSSDVLGSTDMVTAEAWIEGLFNSKPQGGQDPLGNPEIGGQTPQGLPKEQGLPEGPEAVKPAEAKKRARQRTEAVVESNPILEAPHPTAAEDGGGEGVGQVEAPKSRSGNGKKRAVKKKGEGVREVEDDSSTAESTGEDDGEGGGTAVVPSGSRSPEGPKGRRGAGGPTQPAAGTAGGTEGLEPSQEVRAVQAAGGAKAPGGPKRRERKTARAKPDAALPDLETRAADAARVAARALPVLDRVPDGGSLQLDGEVREQERMPDLDPESSGGTGLPNQARAGRGTRSRKLKDRGDVEVARLLNEARAQLADLRDSAGDTKAAVERVSSRLTDFRQKLEARAQRMVARQLKMGSGEGLSRSRADEEALPDQVIDLVPTGVLQEAVPGEARVEEAALPDQDMAGQAESGTKRSKEVGAAPRDLDGGGGKDGQYVDFRAVPGFEPGSPAEERGVPQTMEAPSRQNEREISDYEPGLRPSASATPERLANDVSTWGVAKTGEALDALPGAAVEEGATAGKAVETVAVPLAVEGFAETSKTREVLGIDTASEGGARTGKVHDASTLENVAGTGKADDASNAEDVARTGKADDATTMDNIKADDASVPESVATPGNAGDAVTLESVAGTGKADETSIAEDVARIGKVDDASVPEIVARTGKVDYATTLESVAGTGKADDASVPEIVAGTGNADDATTPESVARTSKVDDASSPDEGATAEGGHVETSPRTDVSMVPREGAPLPRDEKSGVEARGASGGVKQMGDPLGPDDQPPPVPWTLLEGLRTDQRQLESLQRQVAAKQGELLQLQRQALTAEVASHDNRYAISSLKESLSELRGQLKDLRDRRDRAASATPSLEVEAAEKLESEMAAQLAARDAELAQLLAQVVGADTAASGVVPQDVLPAVPQDVPSAVQLAAGPVPEPQMLGEATIRTPLGDQGDASVGSTDSGSTAASSSGDGTLHEDTGGASVGSTDSGSTAVSGSGDGTLREDKGGGSVGSTDSGSTADSRSGDGTAGQRQRNLQALDPGVLAVAGMWWLHKVFSGKGRGNSKSPKGAPKPDTPTPDQEGDKTAT